MLHGYPAPKLGLLFLTIGDVNNPDIWQEFLDQAGPDVSIFSHVKHRENLGPGFIADSMISKIVETRWGKISLVRAMLALLEEAYADPETTHFAFLSGSCIPIKSWPRIRRNLQDDPRSMIAIKDGSEMLEPHSGRHRSATGIAYEYWRTHPQWVLLDREAAGCILQRDATEQFECVFAPDEHYFGTVLAMRGFPDSRINPVPPTWVDWSSGLPAVHDSIDAGLAGKLARSPSFFARKFPESADLPRLVDLDSHIETSPSIANHG
jgi:hypothetical protein